METLLSLNSEALNSLTREEHLPHLTLLLSKCVKNVSHGQRLHNILWRLSFSPRAKQAPISETLRPFDAPIVQFATPAPLLPTPSTDSESHVKLFVSPPVTQPGTHQSSPPPTLVVVDPTPNPTPQPTPPATPFPAKPERSTHVGPASQFRSESALDPDSSRRAMFQVGVSPPCAKERNPNAKFNIGSSSPSPTQQSDPSPPENPQPMPPSKLPPKPPSKPSTSHHVQKSLIPNEQTLATLEAVLVPKEVGKKKLALISSSSDDEYSDEDGWLTSEDEENRSSRGPQPNPTEAADAMYTAARHRRNLDPQPSSAILHSKLSELEDRREYESTLFQKLPKRSYSSEANQPRKGFLSLLMNPPPEVFPVGHPERIRSEERLQRSRIQAATTSGSGSNLLQRRVGGLAMGGLTMTRLDPPTQDPDSNRHQRSASSKSTKASAPCQVPSDPTQKKLVSIHEQPTKMDAALPSVPHPVSSKRLSWPTKPPSITSISCSVSRPSVVTTTQTVEPIRPYLSGHKATASKPDQQSPSPPGLRKPPTHPPPRIPPAPPGRGIRLGPAPADMEMEESSDEDNDERNRDGDTESDAQPGGVSKSLAFRRLQELAGKRTSPGEHEKGKAKHGMIEKERRMSHASMDPRYQVRPPPPQQAPIVSPGSATPVAIPSASSSTTTATLVADQTQIVQPQYPYNLPPPNPPSTPRTTRQLMLRKELPESLRQNLLWSRHVAKDGVARRWPRDSSRLLRSQSHGDVGLMEDPSPRRRKKSVPSQVPTVKSLVQLVPRSTSASTSQLRDEESEREERKRRVREEQRMNRGLKSSDGGSEFHLSGW